MTRRDAKDLSTSSSSSYSSSSNTNYGDDVDVDGDDDDDDDHGKRNEMANMVSGLASSPRRYRHHGRGRSRKAKLSINSSGTTGRTSTKRTNTTKAHDEPFYVTFIKVGITLFLLSMLSYAVFLQRQFWSSNNNYHLFRQDQSTTAANAANGNSPTSNPPRQRQRTPLNRQKRTKLPTPVIGEFEQEQAHLDAFGIANATLVQDPQYQEFVQLAALRRLQFATLVGGSEEARAILQRSLLTVQPSILPATTTTKEASVTSPHSLAQRFRNLRKETNPNFIITILGSSAAARAGNNPLESYASVTREILTPVLESLGIHLVVRNLAVDETTEFPFIWCRLANDDDDNDNNQALPDILIWDYGPTTSPESFEAFLRNLAARSTTVDNNNNARFPFLFVRDTKIPVYNDRRDQLLGYYVDHNALVDPLLIHTDRAVAPYLKRKDKDKPEMFQEWKPMSEEHDSQLQPQQHNMTGWLISMFLLSSLELMAADLSESSGGSIPLPQSQHYYNVSALLPPPLIMQHHHHQSTAPKTSWLQNHKQQHQGEGVSSPAWLPMLLGEPAEQAPEKFTSNDQNENDDEPNVYQLSSRGIQCRTSYFTTQTPETLKSIILSGVASNSLDANQDDEETSLQALLLPKGSMYSSGWVPDLDLPTKRKMLLSQPWGPSDTVKKSYYGYPRSGDLKLFLPLSNRLYQRAEKELKATGFMPARYFIDTITICEADLPVYDDDEETCRLYRDAYVYVDGAMAFLEPLPLEVASSCVTMNVPDEANLAYSNDAEDANQGQLNQFENNVEKSLLGLSIVVRVTGVRGSVKKPCSVAHVLWNNVEYHD